MWDNEDEEIRLWLVEEKRKKRAASPLNMAAQEEYNGKCHGMGVDVNWKRQ